MIIDDSGWKTKPTDRFILKWIKLNLSARITPHLAHREKIKPWMITITSAFLGTMAGLIFGAGLAWLAGVTAAASQILDGVDGQLARIRKTASPAGAFLDSVLDRYADGAMVIGTTVYLVRLPAVQNTALTIVTGALALIGSNLVSYSSARAESLNIDLGSPTLASKGTRSTVMIIAALATVFWPAAPVIALYYLAVHPNCVIIKRLITAYGKQGMDA